MLRTILLFLTDTNVRHLVGLACMAWTGVSREPDHHMYDELSSTLTYLLHYDVSRPVIVRTRDSLLYDDVRADL